MFEIVNKKDLNQAVVLLEVSAPFIAKKAQPGQFIIFRTDEFGERVPLTIADFDRDKGTVTIIVQKIGRATKILGSMEVGDAILDFVGPLGCPTNFGAAKKVCIIGGGVGCAIAYPQAKALYHMGCAVDIIAGFRSKEIVILEEEMKEICNHLMITTDDGSYGKQGFVTDALHEQIQQGADYDLVVAIGPIPMMKFVCELTKKYQIKTMVSLNPIMIDGTGMCGCCRVTVGGKTKFACVDGPDFDGHQVDFDELMKRNSNYRQQEEKDNQHVCRLTGGVRHG